MGDLDIRPFQVQEPVSVGTYLAQLPRAAERAVYRDEFGKPGKKLPDAYPLRVGQTYWLASRSHEERAT